MVILAALIMCGLILSASGSSQAYMMSVNDKVVPMTAENMPLISGSQLYIPYIMLSSQVTEVSLGVRAHYNSGRGTLTVTDGRQVITFDLRKNTAHDAWGTALDARALVRNSMAYLPIDWLCSYFDRLEYSLTYTPYGILVRLVNEAVILSDAEFIDAADNQLRQNLQSYQNSLITPTPTATAPTPTPSVSVEPSARVYLALQWGSQASEAADLLEKYGQRALFLLDYRQLMRQDDLVRRLVAEGHQVGLLLTGGDGDYCLEELEYGRELMGDISRSAILIVSAPGLDEEGSRTLGETGCALWTATRQADGMSRSAVLRRLSSDEPNFVELTCNAAGLELLNSLLPYLTGENYDLRQALAPALQN